MKPALLLVVLLAGCARTEDASVRPDETNDSAVEQVRTTAGDEQEPALGEWRTALLEERPALEFGPAGTAPLLTIVCGERGGLVLQRRGALQSGAAQSLSVTVGGQGRQIPVTAGSGATPTQNASIAPGDTLLQQLAAAQAPIAIRFGDGTPLILPQSPLIGQFAQGCAGGRTGAPAANAQAPAADNAVSNEANGNAAR